MGSKRSKKLTKQELEPTNSSDKINIKSSKQREPRNPASLLSESDANTTDNNNENNVVVPRTKKRKKRNCCDDGNNNGVAKKAKTQIEPEQSIVDVKPPQEVTKKAPKNNKKRSSPQPAVVSSRRSAVNDDDDIDSSKSDIKYDSVQSNECLLVDNNNISLDGNHGKNGKVDEIIWPDEDINELFHRMAQLIPNNDSLSYSTRVEKLDWDKIIFKSYSVQECKKTWFFVIKHIRRYRLLSEVLADAKEFFSKPRADSKQRRHPDMPRRPLSSYLLFYLDKKGTILSTHPQIENTEIPKIMSQAYKDLSPEKRQKYEAIANELRDEYKLNLKKFYDLHPDLKKEKEIAKKPQKEIAKKPQVEKPPKKCLTPFNLFYADELNKTNEKEMLDKIVFRERCKAIWKDMPDKIKIVWITLAEADEIRFETELKQYRITHPDYVLNRVVKSILTKEEKVVKERAAGKPVKPPTSAYSLYVRNMLRSNQIKSVDRKERMNYISNMWKGCSEADKNSYRDITLKMNESYKAEYATYLESLPEDKRQLELNSTMQKKKSTVASTVTPPSKAPAKLNKKKTRPSKKIAKPSSSSKKSVTSTSTSSSTSSSASRKKKFDEPPTPPVSASKYFATLYKGDDNPMIAWKALTSEEKSVYKRELVEKKQAYIVEFERFLCSLSKEELQAFSKSRQAKTNDESSDCSSSQSEGDDDDDDDDDSEEDDNAHCTTEVESD